MLLLFTLAMLASDPVAGANPPVAETAPAKPKLICKTLMITGSRLGGGKRECRTKAAWALFQRNTEDEVGTMANSTPLAPPGGGR